MDYLSELLESFDQLKKRTYKLTFINEADDKAPEPAADPKTLAQAESLVRAAMAAAQRAESAAQGTPINDTTGKPSNVKCWKNIHKKSGNEVTYLYYAPVGGNNATTFKAIDEKGMEKPNAIKGAAEVLAKGEAKPSPEDQGALDAEQAAAQAAEQAKAQEKELRKTIDGTFKANGREDMKKAPTILKRLQKKLQDAVMNPRRQNLGRLSGVKIADRMRRAADKISSGQMLEVDEKGKAKMAPMDTNTSAEVAENLERFYNIFTEAPNEDNALCENARNNVAIYKGDMVVMDHEGKNGIVVTSNKNLTREVKSAMELYADECGIEVEDFIKLGANAVATNTLNAVKGTFFESMAEALIMAMAGDTKGAAKILKESIESNHEILKELGDRWDPNKGMGLDEFYDATVQMDLLKTLNEGGAADYVRKNMALLYKAVKFAGADGVFRSSKTSTTGGREDIYFTYDDCDKAAKVAKAIGSEVRKDLEDAGKPCAVGLGLKFTDKDGAVKGGEIGSIARQSAMFLEGLMDKDIEPGFYDKISEIVFGDDANAQPRLNAARELHKGIESEVATLTTFLHGPRQYVDKETGETKAISANESMEMVQKQITELLGPEALKAAPLRDMLYDVDAKGKMTPKDLTGDDPESEKARRRVGEIMGRMLRWERYAKALADPATKQAASDSLKYQACLSGANAREMAQMKATQEGKVRLFSQNEALRQAFEGEVEVNGFGCTFGGKVRYGQERASTKDGAATRSTTNFSTESMEGAAAKGNFDAIVKEETPQKVEDDILRIFLKGQMELLEGLLNQTKD